MKSKCFRPKVRPGLLCMGDADAWCAKGEHYDDKDPSCEFAETRVGTDSSGVSFSSGAVTSTTIAP